MGNRKSNRKAARSLKKIAKKYGVSEEEVRNDISLAVSAAKENPDPLIQAFWDSIPSEGDKPTPEEVVAHIAGIAEKRISHNFGPCRNFRLRRKRGLRRALVRRVLYWPEVAGYKKSRERRGRSLYNSVTAASCFSKLDSGSHNAL